MASPLSGSPAAKSATQRVVVVGASWGGLAVSQALEKAAAGGAPVTVTVVEPRDHLFVNFSAVSGATVSAEVADASLIPTAKAWKADGAVTHVRGWALGVDAAARTVRVRPVDAEGAPAGDERTLPYDFLVLAPGAEQPVPMSAPVGTRAARAALAASRAAVAAAARVVFIGGGATGVEAAGEVKTAFPAKTVTVIHSGAALCSSAVELGKLTPRFQELLAAEVAAAGVAVELNSRVADLAGLGARPGVTTLAPGLFAAPPGGAIELVTASKKVSADLVFITTGAKPATGWLAGSGVPLTPGGLIQVDGAYRVPGCGGAVFALGDAAGSRDARSGYVAGNYSGPMVAANVAALARARAAGKPEPALKRAPEGGHGGVIICPVGPKLGMAQLPGVCGPNYARFVTKFKSADYMTGQSAAQYAHTTKEEVLKGHAARGPPEAAAPASAAAPATAAA